MRELYYRRLGRLVQRKQRQIDRPARLLFAGLVQGGLHGVHEREPRGLGHRLPSSAANQMASFSSRGFAMSGAPSASFAVRSIQRRSSALRGADSMRLSSATVGSCASNGVMSASSLNTFIGAG